MDFSEKKDLLEKIAILEEEKADLEIMLEAVTGHSDGVAEQLLEKVRKMVETSEKRFRLITETIPVPVLVTQESDGLIIYANHFAADLFKIPVSSLLKCNIMDFYCPEQRKEVLEHIKKHGFLRNKEIQGKRADKTLFRAELTVQPFFYNEKTCLLSVWYDITNQRILEEQLRQSQKMEAVGTLAGGIAHDFNNILTAIFGYTELSMNMVPPESRISHNLKQIFRSAVRAKELVMQILAFCRHSDHAVKNFRIAMIVNEAVKMLCQIIPSHIRVNVSIKSPDAVIAGDPTQIHQVLINLCSNAADAIHKTAGCIDIFLNEFKPDMADLLRMPELQPNQKYIKLSVTDNGPGMSQNLLNRIFDPFFTTKPPGKGTGMGLSVVHGIVKNHGGAIIVKSKPDKGTSFHVYIPQVSELEKHPVSKEQERPIPGCGRILLVDDEDKILEAYKEILETLGYQADICSSPEKAVEIFSKNPSNYDLIITDYSMPDMTGNKLAGVLIGIRHDIPVILYTGHNDPVIRKNALQAGVIDILIKPFTHNELAEMLQKYIKPDSGS